MRCVVVSLFAFFRSLVRFFCFLVLSVQQQYSVERTVHRGLGSVTSCCGVCCGETQTGRAHTYTHIHGVRGCFVLCRPAYLLPSIMSVRDLSSGAVIFIYLSFAEHAAGMLTATTHRNTKQNAFSPSHLVLTCYRCTLRKYILGII